MPAKAEVVNPQNQPEVFLKNQVVRAVAVLSRFEVAAGMPVNQRENRIQIVLVKDRIVTKPQDKNQRARAFSVNQEDQQEEHIHHQIREVIVLKDLSVKVNAQKDHPLNAPPADHPAEIFQDQVVEETVRKEVNKKVTDQK